MTRARILADYVSSGDELALKAPLASPAFTGSPSITLGSDATGDVYYRAAGGALTRLATTADGQVLTSTGVGAVPAWEALPSSSRMKELDDYWTDAEVNDGTDNLTDLNISGAHYITVTPDATTDILEWSYDFNCWGADAYSGSTAFPSPNPVSHAPAAMGWGLQWSETVDGTGLTGSPTNFWRNGQHTIQWSVYDNHQGHAGGTFVLTAAECGMSAATTYYVRLTGASSSTDSNNTWGAAGPQENEGRGVRLLMKRWSAS